MAPRCCWTISHSQWDRLEEIEMWDEEKTEEWWGHWKACLKWFWEDRQRDYNNSSPSDLRALTWPRNRWISDWDFSNSEGYLQETHMSRAYLCSEKTTLKAVHAKIAWGWMESQFSRSSMERLRSLFNLSEIVFPTPAVANVETIAQRHPKVVDWSRQLSIVIDKGQVAESFNHLCTFSEHASSRCFHSRTSRVSWKRGVYDLHHKWRIENAIDLQSWQIQIWVRSMGASVALTIGFRCVAGQWLNITPKISTSRRRTEARVVLQLSMDFWMCARFRLGEFKSYACSVSTSMIEISCRGFTQCFYSASFVELDCSVNNEKRV